MNLNCWYLYLAECSLLSSAFYRAELGIMVSRAVKVFRRQLSDPRCFTFKSVPVWIFEFASFDLGFAGIDNFTVLVWLEDDSASKSACFASLLLF
jgi:hypothetical protein